MRDDHMHTGSETMHAAATDGQVSAAGAAGAAAGRPGRAWCAVGGARGGLVVPRWFGVLPELGVERVHLFWSVPEVGGDAALEELRTASGRWLAELRMLGLEGELSIKRGDPGPWLASLTGLSGESLVVLGPPAREGGESRTLAHLLATSADPLLILPDLGRLPVSHVLARPVVDAATPAEADELARQWGWDPAEAHRVDLSRLDAARAARAALRVAEDVDATLLVLARRGDGLLPAAVQLAALPVLVPAFPELPD